MSLSLIIACDEDYGIGNGNDLLYHFPEDLKRFKKLTGGATLVMGRKTWESLPKRLPGRKHVVFSHAPVEGADLTVQEVGEVLKLAETEPVWVIGGAQVYELLLPYVERVELTMIFARRPGDVRVPFLEAALSGMRLVGNEALSSVDRRSGDTLGIAFTTFENPVPRPA